jgi:hypothetical protein
MIEVLEMDESKAAPIFFTESSPERGASKQEWQILARAIEYRWKTGNLCADDAVMDLHRAVLEIGEDPTLTEDEMDDLMHMIARMQMRIGCRRETYEAIIRDTLKKVMEVLL